MNNSRLLAECLDTDRHRIGDPGYADECRAALAADGVLVLPGFMREEVLAEVVAEFAGRQDEAYFTRSTHNVYLTPVDPELDAGHPYNRQVVSSKGLLADDQVPDDSPLRTIYDDAGFRAFLAAVLDVDEIHPYADELSSVNVHFAATGQELGWHFDNSSFAVTLLLRAPEGGGRFEYVPAVRDADAGDMGFERVAAVLDGEVPVQELELEPGGLVLFRGRDALHRVTSTQGPVTRLLVVFAYNSEPGIGLSDSALHTFYGRTS